jgi:bacillithiol system protein YtxJ
MLKDLENISDFDKALQDSREAPVYIYKHSSSCNISRGAWRAVQELSEEKPDLQFRRIMVRENKPLSTDIAQKLGVEHQSPQIILVNNGVPIWSATHYSITRETIMGALKILKPGEGES